MRILALLFLLASSAQATPPWLQPQSYPTYHVSPSSGPNTMAVNQDGSIRVDVNVTTGTVWITTIAVRGPSGHIAQVGSDGRLYVDISTGPFSIYTNGAPLDVSEVGAADAAEGLIFEFSYGPTTISGAGESDHILFVNPSTNTKYLAMETMSMASLDSGASMVIQWYAYPVVTSSGTPVQIGNTYIGHSNTSTAEVYEGPTISDRGTLIALYQARDTMMIDEVRGRWIIPPEAAVLMTIDPSIANKDFYSMVRWKEALVP